MTDSDADSWSEMDTVPSSTALDDSMPAIELENACSESYQDFSRTSSAITKEYGRT